MPVLCDLTISVDPENLLRRAGIAHASGIRGQMQEVLSELLAEVERCKLLQPCIAYEIHTITDVQDKRVMLGEGVYITSSFIASLSPAAKAVAAVVCTIGPDLESKAAELFRNGEQLRGFLLDGIGSAAVDALAGEACHIIEEKVSMQGFEAGSPLSPGMPGLSISEQGTLFSLVPASEIGVSLTPHNVMVPLKSLSMVVCIGMKLPIWSKIDMCNRCNLSKTCSYKLHAAS